MGALNIFRYATAKNISLAACVFLWFVTHSLFAEYAHKAFAAII